MYKMIPKMFCSVGMKTPLMVPSFCPSPSLRLNRDDWNLVSLSSRSVEKSRQDGVRIKNQVVTIHARFRQGKIASPAERIPTLTHHLWKVCSSITCALLSRAATCPHRDAVLRLVCNELRHFSRDTGGNNVEV